MITIRAVADNASHDGSESLLKEIAMMLAIGRHEYIVSIVACCTTGPRTCLVMDYCDGGDLLSHLHKLRTLASDAVSNVTGETCLLTYTS